MESTSLTLKLHDQDLFPLNNGWKMSHQDSHACADKASCTYLSQEVELNIKIVGSDGTLIESSSQT